MCACRAVSVCPLDAARARKRLGECPREAAVWRRIPGYEDVSDNSESSEDEELHAIADSRFEEIDTLLGSRGVDAQLIAFVPPERPSKATSSPAPEEGASGNSTCVQLPDTCAGASCLKTKQPSFRICQVHAPLVEDIFLANGFRRTEDNDWAIRWSGGGVRDQEYKEMAEHQRINHFPGSSELTRKDRMFEHVERMQQTFGEEEFDFVPETYILPRQTHEFRKRFKSTASGHWIMKPSNSSCGRGISIVRNLRDVPVNQPLVVSKYVSNPLLIQGLKFDLRIYVLVTAFDPLRAYIYREGLVRFACKPYSLDKKHMQDTYRHLTNYSVNKEAKHFRENKEVEKDNYGHKWSISALNKHLRHINVDVDLMWCRIMDLVTKTLLAVEPAVSAKVLQVAAHRSNSFEVYGFDVLVDEQLKPWLLEVNLSPSMQAESPLDWQVKSSLLSDSFNLVGVPGSSRQPMLRRSKPNNAAGGQSPSNRRSKPQPPKNSADAPRLSFETLAEKDLKVVARAFQELQRSSNFIRLFPTRGSIARYAPIMEVQAHMVPRLSANRLSYSPWLSLSQIIAYALWGPTSKPKEKISTPTAKHRSTQGRRNIVSAMNCLSQVEDDGSEATTSVDSSPASKKESALTKIDEAAIVVDPPGPSKPSQNRPLVDESIIRFRQVLKRRQGQSRANRVQREAEFHDASLDRQRATTAPPEELAQAKKDYAIPDQQISSPAGDDAPPKRAMTSMHLRRSAPSLQCHGIAAGLLPLLSPSTPKPISNVAGGVSNIVASTSFEQKWRRSLSAVALDAEVSAGGAEGTKPTADSNEARTAAVAPDTTTAEFRPLSKGWVSISKSDSGVWLKRAPPKPWQRFCALPIASAWRPPRKHHLGTMEIDL